MADFLRAHEVCCPRCNYSLHGLERAVCPECGTAYTLAGGTLLEVPEHYVEAAPQPLPAVKATELPSSELLARTFLARATSLGHFLGMIVTGCGLLSWIAIALLAFLGLATVGLVRPLLALAIAGTVAPVGLMASASRRGHNAPGKSSRARDWTRLAMAWSWVLIFMVVWLVV